MHFIALPTKLVMDVITEITWMGRHVLYLKAIDRLTANMRPKAHLTVMSMWAMANLPNRHQTGG